MTYLSINFLHLAVSKTWSKQDLGQGKVKSRLHHDVARFLSAEESRESKTHPAGFLLDSPFFSHHPTIKTLLDPGERVQMKVGGKFHL